MEDKKYKIAVIGGGNMGGAITSALSKKTGYQVFLYERTEEKAKALEKECGVTLLKNMEDALGMDVILIALKPQNLPSFYKTLSSLDPGLFISICAGVDISTLEKNLKTEKIVRYMPNIGAKVGKSVTAVALSQKLDEEERDLAMDIALSFGDAFALDESLFSTFIGISGSAIAFMFDFMHSIAMAGVKNGIPYSKALSIVSGTMESAAMLQKATGNGAIELETMVCSPRGTTIEGVRSLCDNGFSSIVQEAVDVTIEKSEEMTRSAKENGGSRK